MSCPMHRMYTEVLNERLFEKQERGEGEWYQHKEIYLTTTEIGRNKLFDELSPLQNHAVLEIDIEESSRIVGLATAVRK